MKKYLTLGQHRSAPTPDHKAVVIKVNTHTNPRGKGYWKLNTSVLEEEDYVIGIKDLIKKTILEFSNDICKGKLWELIKVRIKEFSIKYCQLRSVNR